MKYKVISLYCPNGASKVFNSGDIVTEADFAEGIFAEKLKRGFLELVPGQTPEPPAQDPPPAADSAFKKGEETDLTASSENQDDKDAKTSTDESAASDIAETLKKTVEGTTGESVENVPHETSGDITVKIDDISIKQIRDDLKKAGIEFDKNASKEVLFDLWQKRELTETI